MRKFKYLLSVALYLTVGSAVVAGAENPKSLLVTHTDGSTLSVALSNTLSLSVDPDNIILTDAPASLSLAIPRNTFASFELSAEEAGLTDVTAEPAAVGVVVTPVGIHLSNLPTGSRVEVYDAKGACVYHSNTLADALLIASDELPGGVAVIVVNSFTFKVVLQ